MADHMLSIDVGTTGSTVLVVRPDGGIVGRGYREHPQHFPQPGWVEHDPQAIWQSVLDAATDAVAQAGLAPADIAAVGITNQRETVVCWDSATGDPVGPCVVWQDRRTAQRCAELRASGQDGRIRELTGLPVDPYFSATKVEWVLREVPAVREAASAGRLRLGTVDSWLVHRLTSGEVHATDPSNASRTMLYDVHAGRWSDELCAMFGVDPAWLPTVHDSAGVVGQCDPSAFLGISAPIAGIAGDQQSALFGQACHAPGQAKATFGTGAFVLVNSAGNAPTTERLLSTVAWRLVGEQQLTYALEGSMFTAGASVQWLRDGLEIVGSAKDIEPLARSVDDTGGVVLVPAFAGLGAPHWDAEARGALLGLTRGTTRAHVARATLEAVAFRIRQVIGAMRDEGTDVTELRVDGGMAANDLLLELLASTLGIAVTRPEQLETTALGAAHLAALGAGIHGSLADAAATWRVARVVEPVRDDALEERFQRFERAVELAREFASSPTATVGTGATA